MLRRFIENKSANVAMLFGLSIIPLFAAMGAAVDFSRAYQYRSMTQDALDAAALSANRLIGIKSEAEIRAEADRFYQANMANVPNTPPYEMDIDGGEVTLTTTLHVDTFFLGIVGMDELIFDLRARTVAGNATYEVVLALDNTGSMSGSKISTLRTAAADLVNTLFEVNELNTQPDPIKIGLVPFAAAVNVGPQYATATWMDTTGVGTYHAENFTTSNNNGVTHNRFALYTLLPNVSWAGCVENRPYPFDVNDAVPTLSDPRSLFVPMFAPDEPDTWSSWGPNGGSYNSGENDYLNDRGGTCPSSPSNPSASIRQARTCKYSGVNLTNFSGTNGHDNGVNYGPNYSCTTNPLQPMTGNQNTILSQIAAMGASGNTNIHDGLIWGWKLLSPTVPFTEGRAYNTQNNFKILILMTDGDNTYGQDRSPSTNRSTYASYGYVEDGHLGTTSTNNSTVVDKMDERTLEACTNIKATDDILIYTIGFQVSTQSTLNLLRDCATDPSMAYQSTSNADLIAVFQQIAANISTLRVAE